MSTQSQDVEEVGGLLATPDEEMKLAIQMQRVKEYTIRPGLMRLPVKSVDSAKNAEQYVLCLDHPFLNEADTRFHIDKPAYWDKRKFEWPRLLSWYGYGPGSQYHLQTDRLYVRYDHVKDEWTLTKPPSEWNTTMYRLSKQLTNGPRWLSVPTRGVTFLYRRTVGRMRRASPSTSASAILTGTALAFIGTLATLGVVNSAVGAGAMMSLIGYSLIAALVMFVTLAVAFQPPEDR